MFPLGEKAPDFQLLDVVSGKTMALNELASDVATAIMFICNHCPYVKHIAHELPKLASDYTPRGVQFIAICANDADTYPDDAPDKMKEFMAALGHPFPYLHDASQTTAKAYQAACTPDFFVFDKRLHCVYRGRLDGSSPGNGVPVTGEDIRAALDALLAGKSILEDQQKPSIGCSIKWR